MTPYAALQQRVRMSPASPLITYRDLATGERMELSALSLDNAIAKTAGLLRDELDIEPGAIVAVHLPLHWQRVVWLGACSALGTVFAHDADPSTSDVLVTDRDHLGLTGTAREDVVVSLAAFGLPEPGDLPAGATDAAVAMRAHPDVFVPDLPTEGDAPLLLAQGQVVSGADVMSGAAKALEERRIPHGGRFALTSLDAMTDVLALAGSLHLDGSAVLIAHRDQGDVVAALRDEGVSPGAGWAS